MICFRRLSSHDVDEAMKINTAIRDGILTQEAAENFLSDPHNWLFVAVHSDEIIAFAYGYELLRLDGGRMLYIHEVAVAECRQRQGIGTGMLNALFRKCAAEGIRKCFLTTCRNNTGANALYRKLGGEVSPDSCGDDVVYWFRPEVSK